MLIPKLATLALMVLAAAAGAAGPTYRNPVLDLDFPDPDVVATHDGWFYAYATQAHRGGRWTNVQVARSRDLVRWEVRPDALPEKPAWARKTQNFWAPNVVRRGDEYLLYFSAEKDTKDGFGIGVATSRSPDGPFVPRPAPLVSGASFENIDPFAFDDPATGRRWLYWGSAHQPIRVQELAADGLSLKVGSRATPVIPASAAEYERLIEGAWVMLRDGRYYLFYSGDNCCGEHAHYAALVARASSPTGPFERLGPATGKPDSVILGQNAHWIAPGHNSLVKDGAGRDWIVYHAIDAQKQAAAARTSPRVDPPRALLIDRVTWQGGWPRIARGAPSFGARPAPVPLVPRR